MVINYQRAAEAADEVRRLIGERGVHSLTYQADVSHEDEALRMVDDVLKEFGHLDILVNNAGITRDKSFLKMTRAMWDEVLEVNLTGPFNVTHAVLPAMIEAGYGRIINISSIVGQMGNFGQANYAVTKGGLIAFTKSLAREVAQKGITVDAVAQGFIETDMLKHVRRGAGRGKTGDSHGPTRPSRRGGCSRSLPGQSGGQLHHRAGHTRQRRYVYVGSSDCPTVPLPTVTWDSQAIASSRPPRGADCLRFLQGAGPLPAQEAVSELTRAAVFSASEVVLNGTLRDCFKTNLKKRFSGARNGFWQNL